MDTRELRIELGKEVHNVAKESRGKNRLFDDFYRSISGGSSEKARTVEVAFKLFDDAARAERRMTDSIEDQLIINAAEDAVTYMVAVLMDEDLAWRDQASRDQLDVVADILDQVEDVLGCRGDELNIRTQDRRPRERDRGDVRDQRRGSSRDNGRSRDTGRRRDRNRNTHGASRNRLNIPDNTQGATAVEAPVSNRRSRQVETPIEQAVEPVAKMRYQADMMEESPELYYGFHLSGTDYVFPTVFQSGQVIPIYAIGTEGNKLVITDQDFIDVNSTEGEELTRIGKSHQEYLIFRRQDGHHADALDDGVDAIMSLANAEEAFNKTDPDSPLGESIVSDIGNLRFVLLNEIADEVVCTPARISTYIDPASDADITKDIVSIMTKKVFDYNIRVDSPAGTVLATATSTGKLQLTALYKLVDDLKGIMDSDAWFELNHAITHEVNKSLILTLGSDAVQIDSFYLDWKELEAHITETYGGVIAAAISGNGRTIAAQLLNYAPEDGEEFIENYFIDLITSIPVHSNALDLAIAQHEQYAIVSKKVTPTLHSSLNNLLKIKDQLQLRSCRIITRDQVSIEVVRHLLTDSILIKMN